MANLRKVIYEIRNPMGFRHPVISPACNLEVYKNAIPVLFDFFGGGEGLELSTKCEYVISLPFWFRVLSLSLSLSLSLARSLSLSLSLLFLVPSLLRARMLSLSLSHVLSLSLSLCRYRSLSPTHSRPRSFAMLHVRKSYTKNKSACTRKKERIEKSPYANALELDCMLPIPWCLGLLHICVYIHMCMYIHTKFYWAWRWMALHFPGYFCVIFVNSSDCQRLSH